MKLKNIFYKFFWKDLYYSQISTRIWPRQRWLTKIIPRQYHDKDYLMELILLKMVTEFVESEIGFKELFDKNRWSKNDKESYYGVSKYQIKFENELKKNYILITKKLPELERDLQRAWDEIPDYSLYDNSGDLYKKTYSKIDSIEKQINTLKTKVMIFCVENRRSMWT